MNPFHHDEPELSVSEEASRWLCELKEGDTAQQQTFFAWLRKSPRHVEEFLFATTTWKKLHRLGERDPQRIERMLAAAEAVERDSKNVVALERSSALLAVRRRVGRSGWKRSLAAAAVLVIGITAMVGYRLIRPPTFTTATGEQRVLRLADGSRVDLNTHSRIAVRFTEGGRDIRLLEGEALFTVARDPVRPFRVDVDGVVIQAVGTQFNVYRQTVGARVSVIEGAVQIATPDGPTQLTAGEETRILPGRRIVKQHSADIADTVAWRERRLVFRATRLEDVVAEVNRYSTRPIRVGDEAAGNVRLTAIFDADHPQSLVKFLREMNGVVVQQRDGETVVRSK